MAKVKIENLEGNKIKRETPNAYPLISQQKLHRPEGEAGYIKVPKGKNLQSRILSTRQGHHSELKEREFPRQVKATGVHRH